MWRLPFGNTQWVCPIAQRGSRHPAILPESGPDQADGLLWIDVPRPPHKGE